MNAPEVLLGVELDFHSIGTEPSRSEPKIDNNNISNEL